VNSTVLIEVKAMLAKDVLLLGEIFNAMEAGAISALDLVEKPALLIVGLSTTTKKCYRQF
jgi:hypothetical protein